MEQGGAHQQVGTQEKTGGPFEVFLVFLKLGCTAFGGPTAHLGYFREELVNRRRWLSNAAYADVIALCQLLPGPTSSQVGMALGLSRAGMAGLLLAFLGFTLPSAALMVGFAYGLDAWRDGLSGGWLAGFRAAAVAVVAHAVVGMARDLCPEWRTRLIALCAVALSFLLGGLAGQFAALAFGLAASFLVPAMSEAGTGTGRGHDFHVAVSPRMGAALLGGLVGLFLLLPLLAMLTDASFLKMANSFYRTGALVFGGGHVVLPLLDAEVVQTGLVPRESFLAGYAAAQAMPGPLFTFAGFLGASMNLPPNGWLGAALALGFIFLPSLLMVPAMLPFWARARELTLVRRMLVGINAAVVGLLGAALINPVLPEGVTSFASGGLVIAAYIALAMLRWSPVLVVCGAAIAGALLL